MCKQLVHICQNVTGHIREKVLWPETLKLLEDDEQEVILESIDLFTNTIRFYEVHYIKPVIEVLNKIIFMQKEFVIVKRIVQNIGKILISIKEYIHNDSF